MVSMVFPCTLQSVLRVPVPRHAGNGASRDRWLSARTATMDHGSVGTLPQLRLTEVRGWSGAHLLLGVIQQAVGGQALQQR